MEKAIRQRAIGVIQTLVGLPVLYAIKSPDTELYDFGFGDFVDACNRRGRSKRIGTHTIHVLCRFKVIWKNGDGRSDRYYEDTPSEVFDANTKHLMGLRVLRVALSDKNDLWLDLGDYWIAFATNENSEESWRFFTADTNFPHLVAADTWLHFDL